MVAPTQSRGLPPIPSRPSPKPPIIDEAVAKKARLWQGAEDELGKMMRQTGLNDIRLSSADQLATELAARLDADIKAKKIPEKFRARETDKINRFVAAWRVISELKNQVNQAGPDPWAMQEALLQAIGQDSNRYYRAFLEFQDLGTQLGMGAESIKPVQFSMRIKLHADTMAKYAEGADVTRVSDVSARSARINAGFNEFERNNLPKYLSGLVEDCVHGGKPDAYLRAALASKVAELIASERATNKTSPGAAAQIVERALNRAANQQAAAAPADAKIYRDMYWMIFDASKGSLVAAEKAEVAQFAKIKIAVQSLVEIRYASANTGAPVSQQEQAAGEKVFDMLVRLRMDDHYSEQDARAWAVETMQRALTEIAKKPLKPAKGEVVKVSYADVCNEIAGQVRAAVPPSRPAPILDSEITYRPRANSAPIPVSVSPVSESKQESKKDAELRAKFESLRGQWNQLCRNDVMQKDRGLATQAPKVLAITRALIQLHEKADLSGNAALCRDIGTLKSDIHGEVTHALTHKVAKQQSVKLGQTQHITDTNSYKNEKSATALLAQYKRMHAKLAKDNVGDPRVSKRLQNLAERASRDASSAVGKGDMRLAGELRELAKHMNAARAATLPADQRVSPFPARASMR